MYTVGGRWNREGERWTPLVRRFFSRHPLAAPQAHRRSWNGATWPSATAGPSSRAASIAGFTTSAFCSSPLICAGITSPETRPAGRAHRRRPHHGPAAAKGRLPGVLCRPAVAVHRHHDERRHRPLGGQCHRRRRLAGNRPGTLPHHATLLGASRWRHGPRRYLRRGDRPVLRQATHQGWSAESTWSRGFAWAIYGFTAVHRLSGQAEFLATAGAVPIVYLRRAPQIWSPSGTSIFRADGLPCGTVPLPPSRPAGSVDLSEQVTDAADAARYREAALTILTTLCSDRFLLEIAGLGRHSHARDLSLSQEAGRG